MLWDRGTWSPEGDIGVDETLRKGDLKFTLNGKKLRGSWALVRTKGYGGNKKTAWLLIKHRDGFASKEDITLAKPRSVASRRLLAQIAKDGGGDVAKAGTGDPHS
jgi:bifunctional non-homologous end joining protein LigD